MNLEVLPALEQQMAMDRRRLSPEMERKVSPEPISLFDLLSREGSSITLLPRINVTCSPSAAGGRVPAAPPPPSPPAKKFLNISLPSPARPRPILVNRKTSGTNQISIPTSDTSATELKKENSYFLHIGRSKSCGEGRASPPSVEYEMCLKRVNTVQGRHAEEIFRKNTDQATSNGSKGLRCGGALCLYLPAFIKGKPLTKKEALDIQSMISRRMSVEKFECGSWSAAAFESEDSTAEDHCSEEDSNNRDRHSMNLYYELPLEMMQAGNLFEKPALKGILANGPLKSSEGRKSNHDSTRHVRFSTESPTFFPSSPPSCITPRLRLARAEFNAFLEAQNA